jgi:LPXTG-site transpeptidase (sortase) family protein
MLRPMLALVMLAGIAACGSATRPAAATPTPTPAASKSCGGAPSLGDAYALVQFGGLGSVDYEGVSVDGNWDRLHDRSMVHWHGSPDPGGQGNSIVTFHREPNFRKIDQLAPGSTVTIQDRACHVYVYTVSERWNLLPDQVTQLEPTSGHDLTLITCDPWWQDYRRLVWRASLTSMDGKAV